MTLIYRLFQLGRTETVKNAASINFATMFELDYYFERQQPVKFVVYVDIIPIPMASLTSCVSVSYDSDGSGENLKNHDLIGEASTTIGAIVGEHSGSFKTVSTHRQSQLKT